MKIKDNSKLIGIVSISLFFFFTISIYFLFNSISNYLDIKELYSILLDNRKASHMAQKIALERDMVILYKSDKKYLSFFKKAMRDNNKLLDKDTKKRIQTVRKRLKKMDRIEFLSHYFEVEEFILEPVYNSSSLFFIDSRLTTLAELLFKIYEAREYSDYERGFISLALTTKKKLDEEKINEWAKYIRNANLSISQNLLSSHRNFDEVKSLLDDNLELEKNIQKIRFSYLRKEKVYLESWFQLLNDKSESLSKIETKLYPYIISRIEEVKNKELQIFILTLILSVIILYTLYIANRISKNLVENIQKIRKVINETPNSEKIEFEIKNSIAKLDSINAGRRVVVFENNSDKLNVIESILDNYNYVFDLIKDFNEFLLNNKYKDYDITVFDLNLVNKEFLEKFRGNYTKKIILIVDRDKELDQSIIKSVDNVVYNDEDINDFRYHFKLTIKQHKELFLKK